MIIQWRVDTAEAVKAVGLIEIKSKDIKWLFEEARRIAKDRTKYYFQAKVGPDENAWAKNWGKNPIMVRSGDLERSMQKDDAYQIGSDSLEIHSTITAKPKKKQRKNYKWRDFYYGVYHTLYADPVRPFSGFDSIGIEQLLDRTALEFLK